MNKTLVSNHIIKTAIGYTRVSTEEQVDGAYRDVQKQAIIDYCKTNDIELLDVYWDGGFSAKNANRPQLQQMILHHGIKVNLSTGEFEKVGTHNLSPLYSCLPPKDDSNEPSLYPLVPATGLEPARLAAYAPKAYVYTNFTTRA